KESALRRSDRVALSANQITSTPDRRSPGLFRHGPEHGSSRALQRSSKTKPGRLPEKGYSGRPRGRADPDRPYVQKSRTQFRCYRAQEGDDRAMNGSESPAENGRAPGQPGSKPTHHDEVPRLDSSLG